MNISIGKKYTLTACILLATLSLSGQSLNVKIDTLNTKTESLIIGLDEVSEKHIWASGTNGTILKSSDGGQSWISYTYDIADSLQFRAIKGISKNKALVMSAGEANASQIFLFDTEGGWHQVYEMQHKDGFLDAIEILSDKTAIAYGDAIEGDYFVLRSNKDFTEWKEEKTGLTAGAGEGGFASSGSNISVAPDGVIWIGTGAGGNANVLRADKKLTQWKKISTPIIKGDAAGITSIRIKKDKLLITGGDLSINDAYTDNLFISKDNGDNWTALPQPITLGAFYGADMNLIDDQLVIIVCGPAGADLWFENSKQWINISNENLWTAEFISENEAILAGRSGKMIKITLNRP